MGRNKEEDRRGEGRSTGQEQGGGQGRRGRRSTGEEQGGGGQGRSREEERAEVITTEKVCEEVIWKPRAL